MFAAVMRYENGTWCHFHCGFRAAHHTFLTVAGTGGVLEVRRPFRPEPREQLLLHRNGGTEEIVVDGDPPAWGEVADIEDAALGIRPARITLAESRSHVATIEALYRAARAQRVTPVS
jgi:hypothetical protein